MSRAQLTILTNICMIEDLEKQRVVMQYRSPESNRWSGYAFPGGHVEDGEAFTESVIREIYEETGLTIRNPQLLVLKIGHWIRVSVILSFVIRLLSSLVPFVLQMKEKFPGYKKTRFQIWIWPMICYL